MTAAPAATPNKDFSWGDVLAQSVKKPLPLDKLWNVSASKEPSLQFNVRVESHEGYYDVNLELETEIVQKALKKLIVRAEPHRPAARLLAAEKGSQEGSQEGGGEEGGGEAQGG